MPTATPAGIKTRTQSRKCSTGSRRARDVTLKPRNNPQSAIRNPQWRGPQSVDPETAERSHGAGMGALPVVCGGHGLPYDRAAVVRAQFAARAPFAQAASIDGRVSWSSLLGATSGCSTPLWAWAAPCSAARWPGATLLEWTFRLITWILTGECPLKEACRFRRRWWPIRGICSSARRLQRAASTWCSPTRLTAI